MPAGGFAGWVSTMLTSLADAVGAIILFIPLLLAAIVVLLIGWGIAKLVQALVTKALHTAHLDRLMEREGLIDALRRAEISATPSRILGVIAYWFVFLIAVYAAVSVMGISALTALMTTVVLYLPRVFAAMLIIVVGAWASSFLARLTRATASTANIDFAPMLGNVVMGTVLFFTFAIALGILGLNFPFLVTAFAILLGGLVLAGTLAFGLGGREYATDWLAGRQLRTVLASGDRVMLADLDGTVKTIHQTTTTIQTTRGDVTVQNAEMLHHHLLRVNRTTGEGGMGYAA